MNDPEAFVTFCAKGFLQSCKSARLSSSSAAAASSSAAAAASSSPWCNPSAENKVSLQIRGHAKGTRRMRLPKGHRNRFAHAAGPCQLPICIFVFLCFPNSESETAVVTDNPGHRPQGGSKRPDIWLYYLKTNMLITFKDFATVKPLCSALGTHVAPL